MNTRLLKSKGLLSLTLLILLVISTNCNSFGFDRPKYAERSNVSDEAVDFLTKTGKAMAQIAEAVKPSVVNISTTKIEKLSESPFAPFFNDPFFRRFFDDRYSHPDLPKERKTASLGSGVIVSSDGYIMTNNHVVKDAEEIKVLLPDKREFEGKIIGTDPKTDLAVIKIEAQNLQTITWGDSDKLQVGEMVLAFGSPYGLDQTVTMGIVSALARANLGITDYEYFIQTDAAINPGNSGGALVTAQGTLVGINTAIFSRTGGYQGIGFAIPSNMAKIVMDSLIKEGRVIRGWLGVSIQPITPEDVKLFSLDRDYGALVINVIEKSPAEKAGIMKYDVIIELNGEKVDDPLSLRNSVANTPPGKGVELKVIRDGKIKSIRVMIGELPAEEEAEPLVDYENVLKGVLVRDLSPEIYERMNIPQKVKGVFVTNVTPDSPSEGKLTPGDVIQEINKKAVTNTQEYNAIVSDIKPDEGVGLLVFRRGFSILVRIFP
jgi:serine protease Do